MPALNQRSPRKATARTKKQDNRRRGARTTPSLLVRILTAILSKQSRIAAALLALLVIITASAWVWRQPLNTILADAGAATTQQFSDLLGVELNELYVSGRLRSSQQEVLTALQARQGQSLFGYDVATARERLLALTWVREARVARRLPDTVEVTLVERQPMALWRRDKRYVVIDAQGEEIENISAKGFSDLPVIVGAGAPENAQQLVEILSSNAQLRALVVSSARIGGRRWDVRLQNGIIVKLPETGMAQAWDRLAEIRADIADLDRGIASVDLRKPEQTILEVKGALTNVKHREGGA